MHKVEEGEPKVYTGAEIDTILAGEGVPTFSYGKYRAEIEAPPEDGIVVGFFTYHKTA